MAGVELPEPDGSSQNPETGTINKDAIIRTSGLKKIYKNKKTIVAVDGVDFSVRRGEIFGLLGPNGAGKTTVVRMLTTLIRPTSGTAWVDSFEISRDPENIRRIIGVCPQNSTLDVELTAWENLEFHAQLFGILESVRRERIPELLRMAGLGDRAHSPVSTFSGGMRRKLEIVRAFINHPLILFLDEPTIGLDPESRREVWQQIRILNKAGTTVILTTHYMDEAERLCERIALMDSGRILLLDTPDNLKKAMPEGDLIEVRTDRTDDRLIQEISRIRNVLSVTRKEGTMIISARDGSGTLPEIITALERTGHPIRSISIRSPSLEDVFIHFTGKHLGEAEEGRHSREEKK